MERVSYNQPTHLFISGVMRCGTTYLATLLDEHPQICFSKPIVPEAKFFLKPSEYEKGREYYKKDYFPRRSGYPEEDLKDRGNKPECNTKILGEKTIHYCEREDALIRIKKWYPDAKHILLLRNPILRSLSHYFFSVRNKTETRSIEEVFLYKVNPPPVPDGMFISPFAYIERSKYIDQLKRLTAHFPKENILVIIAERLFGNIEAVQGIYNWLSVDDSFIPPSLYKKVFSDPVSGHEVPKEIAAVITAEITPTIRNLREYINDDIAEWDHPAP